MGRHQAGESPDSDNDGEILAQHLSIDDAKTLKIDFASLRKNFRIEKL